jgi:uncharacterized protein (TIGR03000 family)
VRKTGLVCVALAWLASGGPAPAQTFYGAGTGGFGVAPGGDRTGYGGGFGYGFGASPGAPPATPTSPGYVPYYPSRSAYLGSSAAGSPYARTGAAVPARAYLDVRVPAGAELWFEGRKTRQAGARRTFWSPPLAPGRRYAYTVTVRWEEGGRVREQTRVVEVRAGARLSVDLMRPAS